MCLTIYHSETKHKDSQNDEKSKGIQHQIPCDNQIYTLVWSINNLYFDIKNETNQ